MEIEVKKLRKLSASILLLTTASSVLDDFERETNRRIDSRFWNYLKGSLKSLNYAKTYLVGNLIEKCSDSTKKAYGEDVLMLEKIINIFINDIETCREIVKGIEVDGEHNQLRDYMKRFEDGKKSIK